MTLREQVARRLAQQSGMPWWNKPVTSRDPHWIRYQHCLLQADAAISCVLAALKEPSEAMVRVGRLENGYVITDIVRTKQEMSDEILSIRYRAMLAQFTRDLGTPGER